MDDDLTSVLKKLRFNLTRLDNELGRRYSVEQDAFKKAREQQGLLEQDLTHLSGDLNRLQTYKAFLDTEDLEVMTTEGESRKQHRRSGLHRTPDFEFSLRTIFPIRNFSYTSSESSDSWKDLICEHGSLTFSAKLKTRAFKDATAEVVLQGWRKEIHRAEIKILESQIVDLTAKCADVSSRKEGVVQRIRQSEARMLEISNRRETAVFDQILVESALANPGECTPLLHSLSAVSSISSVASELQLGSVVESEDRSLAYAGLLKLSQLEKNWLLGAFGAIEKMCSSATDLYRSNVDALNKYSQGLDTVFAETLQACSTSETAKLSQPQSATSLELGAQKDAQKLQDSLDRLKDKWGSIRQSVRDVYEESNPQLTASDRVLKQSHEKVQRAMAMAVTTDEIANQQPVPIGVWVTGLRNVPAEGWMSIYRGLQMEQRG